MLLSIGFILVGIFVVAVGLWLHQTPTDSLARMRMRICNALARPLSLISFLAAVGGMLLKLKFAPLLLIVCFMFNAPFLMLWIAGEDA